MQTPFNLNDNFVIKEANVNIYTEPFVHPARIMQDYDFIYMLQGKWKIGQDDEEFDLKQDDVLILAGNHRHYGIEPCESNTKTMYFHVSIDNAEDENIISLPSLINTSLNPKIKNIFNEVVKSKHMGNLLKATIYFKLLLLELLDNSVIYNANSIAIDIEDVIHKHPEKFYSNNELAKTVHTSVKTAETKFKEFFKTTIHQYTLNYKIKEAISFFKNFPNMTIKEISLNLGFFDEYHFSKQFKKITGISPKQYKNKLFYDK